MRIIFAINHPAASTHYVEYASLAIASARQVGYEPVLLFDGESPPIDVEKIECRSRFSQEMRAALRPDEYLIAAGAMLRLEIPFLFDDEYVLYTDVDVLFLRRLELPTVLHWGMVPEDRLGSHFNSGVSVMHLPELRKTAPGFDDFCRQAILAGRLPSLCWDQGLINASILGVLQNFQTSGIGGHTGARTRRRPFCIFIDRSRWTHKPESTKTIPRASGRHFSTQPSKGGWADATGSLAIEFQPRADFNNFSIAGCEGRKSSNPS